MLLRGGASYVAVTCEIGAGGGGGRGSPSITCECLGDTPGGTGGFSI